MAFIQMEMMSKELNMSTSVVVILPGIPGAHASQTALEDFYQAGKKYPVLWLLHGGGGDAMDYIRYTGIERYAEENGLMVVTPSAMNSSYRDTPYGQNHWTFLTQELWKMVHTCLPASRKREENFVMGLSMGAHGAFKYGVNYPERFCQVICMSGAGFSLPFLKGVCQEGKREFTSVFGDGLGLEGTCDDVFAMARANLKADCAPSFYFPVGGNDFIRPLARECAGVLQELGVPACYEETPGYGHEWDFWDIKLKEVIEQRLPLRDRVSCRKGQ